MEKCETASTASKSSALPYLQFAAILLNGMEKLADIQKSALAAYAEITRNSAGLLKPPAMRDPRELLELAEQAIREFLQIQVRLLDLMLSHSETQPQAARGDAGRDFEAEIAALMLASGDSLLSMQKKALEFMNHQNQTLATEIGDITGSGNASAVIQAQKTFWDVTLKPFRMLRADGSRTSLGPQAGTAPGAAP